MKTDLLKLFYMFFSSFVEAYSTVRFEVWARCKTELAKCCTRNGIKIKLICIRVYFLTKLTYFLSSTNLTKLISVLQQLSCNDDNTRGSVTNLAKRKTGKQLISYGKPLINQFSGSVFALTDPDLA